MIRLPRRKGPVGPTRREIWEEFRSNTALIKAYNITPKELEDLRTAAMLGNMKTLQDFILYLDIRRRTFENK